jgi:hypothetical protein
MAYQFYQKGCHFVGAAILLRKQRGGDEYVVLHLLCQGLEIILKAVLLARDFDKYRPGLRTYRHHLMRLALDAIAEYQLRPLRPAVAAELQNLDKLYTNHNLRYGLLDMIFIDPASIPSRLILKRLAAAMRLAHREFARSFPPANQIASDQIFRPCHRACSPFQICATRCDTLPITV